MQHPNHDGKRNTYRIAAQDYQKVLQGIEPQGRCDSISNVGDSQIRQALYPGNTPGETRLVHFDDHNASIPPPTTRRPGSKGFFPVDVPKNYPSTATNSQLKLLSVPTVVITPPEEPYVTFPGKCTETLKRRRCDAETSSSQFLEVPPSQKRIRKPTRKAQAAQQQTRNVPARVKRYLPSLGDVSRETPTSQKLVIQIPGNAKHPLAALKCAPICETSVHNKVSGSPPTLEISLAETDSGLEPQAPLPDPQDTSPKFRIGCQSPEATSGRPKRNRALTQRLLDAQQSGSLRILPSLQVTPQHSPLVSESSNPHVTITAQHEDDSDSGTVRLKRPPHSLRAFLRNVQGYDFSKHSPLFCAKKIDHHILYTISTLDNGSQRSSLGRLSARNIQPGGLSDWELEKLENAVRELK
ncbi:hypothetical protein MSAN_00774400 [Mycena sanguinolenta]|uniref:Uncharacterized protein n=1 Tax=Mycena sanguinolenta TaxID=230812 RepID=A0A8H7DDE8_9AGAR|nr:hypothetical protein MSAN_00774400 [Mycena sanguinolenta]